MVKMGYYIMRLVIFYIMEDGLKAKRKDMELNIIRMVKLNIMEHGLKTKRMDMEYYMIKII